MKISTRVSQPAQNESRYVSTIDDVRHPHFPLPLPGTNYHRSVSSVAANVLKREPSLALALLEVISHPV
jgi:hypothetical protein